MSTRSLRNMDLLHHSIFEQTSRGLLEAWNRGKVSSRKILHFRSGKPHPMLVLACAHWKILRWDMKAKFCRVTLVQKLSDDHKQQRRNFCEWLLAQDEDFVRRVIWTDENLFVLHQKPHRKNDGKWARENPHEFIESNERNDQKVMIFVAIVEGKISLMREGAKISVNGDCYLKLLQDRVWPLFRLYE